MNEYQNPMIGLEDENGRVIYFNINMILGGIDSVYKMNEKVNQLLAILSSNDLKMYVNFVKELHHLSDFFTKAKEISEQKAETVKFIIQ